MIASVILEEKWRTQERMAEKAGYDLKKYLDNVERIVKKMEKEKGSGFKYAKLRPAKSNFLTPIDKNKYVTNNGH